MAAIRHAIEIIYIPLDPKCEFHGRLPLRFLEDESGRVESLWCHHFCPTITAWCRRSLKSNRGSLEFGLENICNEFSRRTECVKVRLYKEQLQQEKKKRSKFMTLIDKSAKGQPAYSLKLTRLSAIPEGSRRVKKFCCAEIPDLEEAKRQSLREMCTMTITDSDLLDATSGVNDEKDQHDDCNVFTSTLSSTNIEQSTSSYVHLSPDAPNGNRLVPASCAICLTNYSIGDSIVHSSNLTCRHAFHEECLNSWFERNAQNKTCPCCRQTFFVTKQTEHQERLHTN